MEDRKQTGNNLAGKKSATVESPVEMPHANRRKHKRVRREKSYWDTLLILVISVLSVGVGLWVVRAVFDLMISVELGTAGPAGFMVLLSLALMKSMGIWRGLVIFATICVVCTAIWAWIWFAESPEYRAGVKAFDNGDFAAAVENFDIAIKQKPDHAEAYVKRCIALRRIGRTAEALADCNQAIKLDYPFKDESFRARGLVLAELGKPKAAVRDFTVAIKEGPNAYDLYNRGRMYNRLGSYDLAVKDFSQTLYLDEGFTSAYWGMGNALYNQGEREDALKSYERYEKSGEKMTEGLKERIQALRRELRAGSKIN